MNTILGLLFGIMGVCCVLNGLRIMNLPKATDSQFGMIFIIVSFFFAGLALWRSWSLLRPGRGGK